MQMTDDIAASIKAMHDAKAVSIADACLAHCVNKQAYYRHLARRERSLMPRRKPGRPRKEGAQAGAPPALHTAARRFEKACRLFAEAWAASSPEHQALMQTVARHSLGWLPPSCLPSAD